MKLFLLKIAPYAWVIGMIIFAIMILGITINAWGNTLSTLLFNLATWGVLYLANIGADELIRFERSIVESEKKSKNKDKKN